MKKSTEKNLPMDNIPCANLYGFEKVEFDEYPCPSKKCKAKILVDKKDVGNQVGCNRCGFVFDRIKQKAFDICQD